MNPPRIPIKKGAVVYDDAEQDRDIPRPPPPAGRPPRRRRRPGARPLFAPLIVVAAGIFIVFRVVPHAPTNRSVLQGWETTLQVTRFEGDLVVGLTFVARSRPGPAAPPVMARAYLPGTREQVFLAGNLDKSPMTLRGRLADLPGVKVVQAEVSIGTARVMLVAPVPPPAGPAAGK
jgi:hypothetical protein